MLVNHSRQTACGHAGAACNAMALQAGARFLHELGPLINLWARQARPAQPQQRECAQAGGQQAQKIGPAWGFKAQVLQQIELTTLGVVDDPLVPAVVDGLPNGAQLLHGADVDKGADGTGNGAARRLQALKLTHPAR